MVENFILQKKNKISGAVHDDSTKKKCFDVIYTTKSVDNNYLRKEQKKKTTNV